jgi:zinc protease
VRAYFDAPALVGFAGAAPEAPPIPEPRTMAGRIFFVDIPGAAQSQVSYLQAGPPRTAPDHLATSLMAAVFGGGFSSRINMNLREARGYSYGARGSFSYTRTTGAFSVSAQVVGHATYPSILEIDREVRGIASGAPAFAITLDELEREKMGAILGLPGRFATAQAALGQYRALVYFGLPLDYYATYVERVSALTLSEVQAAAARRLDPGQAVYVVVGNGAEPVLAPLQDGADRPNQRAPNTPSTKDQPYTKDGKQLTLREALADLAARGDVGRGGLVELDADGRPLTVNID